MTDLYREVLESIMMRIQAFTPEQKSIIRILALEFMNYIVFMVYPWRWDLKSFTS